MKMGGRKFEKREVESRKISREELFNSFIGEAYTRTDYVFWQYTERGEVKGIGKIDNNRMKQGLNIGDYVLKNFG